MKRNRNHTDDVEVEIARWPANKREIVRVMIRVYCGRKLVDCRRWFTDVGGNLSPGKGISLDIVQLPLLRRALRKAARKLGGSGA